MLEDSSLYLQVILGGLLLGALYALLACGLNLIFGVMRVINVAHGALMMLGAYGTFWLYTLWGVHPLLSLLLVIPAFLLFGILLQRIFVERVVGGPELASLLLTFGLGICFANLALNFWKADFRSVPYLSGAYTFWGLALSRPRVAAFTAALLLTLTTYLFLKKTRLGKAIRATAQQSAVAMLCGIDARRVRRITYGLGAAMAAAAGSLLSTIYSFNPEMGHVFNLKAFAIIVLGGMGSFPGAFWGGLLLGVIEALVAFFWTTQVSEAAAYLLMLLVLLLKPEGLLSASGGAAGGRG